MMMVKRTENDPVAPLLTRLERHIPPTDGECARRRIQPASLPRSGSAARSRDGYPGARCCVCAGKSGPGVSAQ